MRKFLALVLFFPALLSVSQNRELDSIEQRIRKAADPSEIVYEKAILIPKYFAAGRSAEAMTIFSEANDQAQKGVSDKALGALYNTRGILFFYQGQMDSALVQFELAVKHRKKAGDEIGALKTTGNIGNIYLMFKNYDKAQKYYEDAMRMEAALGLEEGEHTSLNNLAAIYNQLKEWTKAIHYYKKAIAIAKKKNQTKTLSASYDGLAGGYITLKKYDSAFYYGRESLRMAEEIGDRMGAGYAHMTIALIHNAKKEYGSAIAELRKALPLALASGDKRLLFGIYGNLVAGFVQGGENDSATYYMERLLPLQQELNIEVNNPEVVRLQAAYYYNKKDYQSAYLAVMRFSQLADSTYQEQIRSKVTEMQEKYESDKKEKANLMLQGEIEKQKTTQRYLTIILVLAILSIVGGVFAFRKISRANTTIKKQKVLVEEKQKEILDSINYAKRIQYALLASEQLLKKHLHDHFVFFNPKDVVSGDFYWANPVEDGLMLLCGDCTGHGVPGAFMSLLNITKAGQIIGEQKISRPDLVLNKMREEIIKVLNPEGGAEETKDGMDAVLCKLKLKELRLEYASANNAFYIVRNNKLLTCNPDKMPVGKGHDDSIPFTSNEVALEKGDVIYLFTDGYADQFGGPLGKKFKYKQLESLLISISHENMDTQKGLLATAFNKWKGDLEQVDDVCVIGIRV